jgi:2-C-methyl-D-erythritol 4-phosphate cytidylyltransferase
LTSAEAELIAVHDAARPFATSAMYSAVLAAAQRHGGAIVGIPVADTLKRAGESGAIIATVARTALWQAQTPQAFRRALLVRAHERAVAERIAATDDADLVERLGTTVMMVEGTGLNFKITTAADLRLAALVAGSRSFF